MQHELDRELQHFSEISLKEGVSVETFSILSQALEALGPDVFGRRVARMFSYTAPEKDTTPPSLRLADHLAPAHVFADVDTGVWDELVNVMLGPLRSHSDLDLTDTLEQLLDGGKRPGWFPGGGIALPHVTVPNLNDTLLLVARTQNDLNVDTMDGVPVRLVFLLLDSAGDPERHLMLLAHIATVCGPAENRGLLLATSGSNAMRDAIIALDYDPFLRDHG